MKWLVRRFAKTLTIEVSPERFVFHYDGRIATSTTRVWVSGDRLVAVGPEGPAGSEAVELFGDATPGSHLPARTALLGAFLQAGIARVIKRRIYIRPIVQLAGLSSFETILSGQQEAVFRQALSGSPAGDVRFA